MSQILNIFQKDARHHWPEVFVSISLLIVFVAEQPHKWTGHPYGIRLLNGLVIVLPTAMILAWVFVIIRVVQSESLVGDREFWITRPYQWHKLLAAKVLSIVVFIHLPFFLSQLVLLRLARFPVFTSIPGLLFVHLLFFIVLIAPSLMVGTVTSGIGQAALAVLGGVLALIGVGAILFTRLNMDVAADSTDSLVASICLGASFTVILLQYLYRRTRVAWMIIGGTLTFVAAIMLFAPYERIISNWFPPPGNNHPIPAHFQLDRALSFSHSGDWSPSSYENDVRLELPFELSDLDDRSLIDIRAIKLDLNLPDGKPWTSNWHSVFNQTVSFGRTHAWPDIEIKKAVFGSVKDSPVKARVTLGLSVYKLGPTSQVMVSENRLTLPGGARCLNAISENVMHCFAALKEPGSIFVVADLPSSACSISNEGKREPWAGSPAFYASLGGSSTPDLDFTPIQQFDLSLSRHSIREDLQSSLPVCSGTRLLISKPEFQFSVRDEIDLGEVTLANYHPTFPRKIIPPAQRPPRPPSDSISDNITPELVQARLKFASH